MSEFIRKHKLLTELAILVLLCILMLTAIEVRQPYFFLQDDNADSYICQYVFSLRSVLSGEFPLYNFHQYAGLSFLDRGQTGQLNIFVYIGGFLSYLFLGHLTGTLDFVAALYLIIGALGMYLLLKKYNLSAVASLIGSIAWSFNSFSIYCGSNWIISIILTGCLPWMIYTSHLMLKENGIKAIICSAIAKTFMFYGGHPQYFVYAIIFDFFFMLCVIFAQEKKDNRLKAELSFTFKYFISGALTTLWSLPLLVPMINSMNKSITRSSALEFDTFVDSLFSLKDFIIGQYNPLMQYDITRVEVMENGESIGLIDTLIAIHKNMSHMGFIVFFALIMAIVILITRRNNKDQLTSTAIVKIAMCLPPMLIAVLWASSPIFNRLIYIIPVLNRFRYPFKLMQYAMFFMIFIAAVSLDYLLESLLAKKEKLLSLLKIALPLIEIVDLIIVYLLLPVRFFGMYTLSPKPFEDEAVDLLKGSRYVFVGDAPAYWDLDTRQRQGNDSVATLGYNYATYLGLSNIGGYDVLLPESTAYSLFDTINNMGNVCANVALYDELVPDMSAHGVSYYVCLLENENEIGEFLEPYGITLCYEDDVKAIFYDALAEPLVFAVTDDDAYGIDFEEHVNYLRIVTDESFEGGMIVANYTHDSHFEAALDGDVVPITDQGNYEKMIINDVPSGSHEIVIRYVDNTFKYSAIVSLAGTALVTMAYIIIKMRKKEEK